MADKYICLDDGPETVFLDEDDELLEAVQETMESVLENQQENGDNQPRAHCSRSTGVLGNRLNIEVNEPRAHCSRSIGVVEIWPENEDNEPRAHCSSSTGVVVNWPNNEDNEPTADDCSSIGQLYMGAEAPGFDTSAGNTWKYPVDFPKREYQFEIIKTAIFQNTLVCLPTGTGKTFIAAVLMYNFYRWYPQGKVIFMAPTRPLVHQQVVACAKFTGLPDESIIVMTGQLKKELRAKEWETRRVIFCTAQTLVNDLKCSLCPAGAVKCVVVDEAHRATGNHSYVQVIKKLQSKSAVFRVLALSATPGNNCEAIKQVVSNLLISRVESRTESSPDIVQYVHKRNIEKIIVTLTGYVKEVYERFMRVRTRCTPMSSTNDSCHFLLSCEYFMSKRS